MAPARGEAHDDLALVMTGGGARAAYQVGLLTCLARHFPELRFPILTGVSAGAINAVQLASRPGSFRGRVEELADIWRDIRVEKVFRSDAPRLFSRAVRWGLRLGSGGHPAPPAPRGLVDTSPLRQFLAEELSAEPDGSLPGIQRSLDEGFLRALAITASSYSTGRSVTWLQGRNGSEIQSWERAHRTGVLGEISLEHVMASAALPLIFPAIQVDGAWYGDGGVRLTAPFSPAVHLGAGRILAISTRYARSNREAAEPSIDGYPPIAQVAGVLLNALFLDMLDNDALRTERINRLVRELPPERRVGMREVKLLIIRPSVDLGRLANDYEVTLPWGFRFLTRGLGTRETRSNDLLSLIMFQPDYISRLLELGEKDAETRLDDLAGFLAGAGEPVLDHAASAT